MCDAVASYYTRQMLKASKGEPEQAETDKCFAYSLSCNYMNKATYVILYHETGSKLINVEYTAMNCRHQTACRHMLTTTCFTVNMIISFIHLCCMDCVTQLAAVTQIHALIYLNATTVP